MTERAKLDLYKEHRDEYAASRKPRLVDTHSASYLAIQGRGAPGGEAFVASIGALYAVAFTIKMTLKATGHDYTVSKLEGIYFGPRRQAEFHRLPREEWRWKLLIRTPGFVKERHLADARATLLAKGKPPEVKKVGLETLQESRCVQQLHVGPYDRVGETVAAMKAFAASQKLRFHGLCHEIYLSDPRRVAPARLRTIVRLPVR